MPERPLVLFAAPTVADKERRYGGAPKYYFPSHSRQVSRLTPQFNVLQNTMNSGSIYFTNYATGVDPEYTLVFETVGDPHDFYKAVDKLKETYPTVEWLMELSDSNLDNSDDFYVMNSQSVRDDSKKLTTKLFCIMTNQVALSEIISLWKHYQTDENFKFPRGMTGFKQLFRTLYDVHKWGIQERLEDTGLTEIWKEELQDASLEKVKVQIELFFRSSISKRQEVEDNIKNIVIQVGGEIFSCSVIPEIEYHAILAAVPREYAQKIIDREEVALVIAEPIMFLKPCVQAIFSSDNNNFSDSNSFSVPTNVIEDPIIAMFDGAPQANHPLLKGMLTVDDPDGFESFYEVRERVHGTSMASLILRGQDMSTIEEKIRKVYVRPIMKPETWNNKVMEYIPDDFLLVDKIHEAVRRLFEPEAGQVASNVRIINLSIGIRDGKTQVATSVLKMFLGTIGGTIGETSALALLIGAAYLLIKKVITWRIPVCYIGIFAIFALIFGGRGFDLTYLAAEICGGGLMLGAFFMATDYVTSPITPKGQIVFGVLLGVLTGIFRIFGASAEGVSYAIIICNLLVPLIEKVTIPVPFGKEGIKDGK